MMPALSTEQRKHPAQAALNQLPDGWEAMTNYYVDTLPNRICRTGDRLLALMRSMHDANAAWTVGHILRYLRDWQPRIEVEMVVHESDRLPMFLMGGDWTEYTFPERNLLVARYKLLRAQREWEEAVEGVADKHVRRARQGAKEMPDGLNVYAMVLGDETCQWLEEWAQANGYDVGLGG